MKNRIGLLILLLTTFLRPQAQETKGEYYIQLAASRTQVSVEDIQKRHGLEGGVHMILQNEWYKYLLGPFDSYDQAFNDMKKRAIEGFVTRYDNLNVAPKSESKEQQAEARAELPKTVIPNENPQKGHLPIGVRLEPMPTIHEKLFTAPDQPLLVPPHSFLERAENSGEFTDPRDDNSYGWIRLGNQIWMTENMRFQMEGARIPSIDSLLPPDYGFLYNAYAASLVCPEGWHLPDDAEWMELELFLGVQPSEMRSIGMRDSGHLGLSLKSTQKWAADGMGLDLFGFRVLPSGFVTLKGDSKDLHQKAYYWTGSRALIGMWIRYFDANFHGIGRGLSSPNKFLSVRCVKNKKALTL